MYKPLPTVEGGFGLIMADPPWQYLTWSDKGGTRGPEYSVMSIDDIKEMPAASCAAKDVVLLLWAIDSMLPEALDVGKAWGFEYKTVGFYWAKSGGKRYGDALQDFFPIGLGKWTRANPEQCLLFTRGNPKRLSASVPRLIVSPRREHSRKPDKAFKYAKELAAGPYLELFSRQSRPGWVTYGNEAGKFDEAAA